MSTPLLSPPLVLRRRNWFLSLALSLLVLLTGSAAQAQTTLYGLGNLTRNVAPGNLFFPPGGVIGNQGLAAFDPASGGPIAFPLRIVGLRPDERLEGIAFRPSTGQLYGLARTATDEVALYIVNTYPIGTTGPARYDVQATPVNAPNSARTALALGGPSERVSFSFNPVADLIRVVSTNNANYRLSPANGAMVTTGGADGPLAYAAGDPRASTDPRIQTVAYTNARPGSTSTELYDIDIRNQASAPSGILSLQNPPNAGTLTSSDSVRLGSNGSFFGIAPEAIVSLDIYAAGTFNKGYLVEVTKPNNNGLSSSNLYDFSLPVSSTSPRDPANTFAPGLASNKRTLVDANFFRPLNIIDFAVAPRATIISLVPNSAEAGTPGLTVTVNGTGFMQGATVQFNGTTRTTAFVSVQQLTVALTAADLAVAGTYGVTVTNPPLPGVPSEPATFTVTPACAAPTNLTASNVTSTSATVSFTGNASATSYTVTTSPVTTTQTLPASATSVSLTGLAANTSYTVSITTTCPSGTTSPAAVTFTTSPAAAPLIAVSQGGTFVANGGTFSGFAGTQQGSTAVPVTFTISNSSATMLTLGAFTFSGPYALSGAAPTTVAAGDSVTFSVAFSPTTTGANSGSVSIANNSLSNNPYVVNFSGQGTSQDLVVTTLQNVSGSYRNVTVTSTGVANLTGPLTVSGTFEVSGNLNTNCQLITGPGNFVLTAGALLNICDANGITLTGPTGSIRLTGTRSYSPAAIYSYNGTVAQVTGNGLPAQIRFLRLGNATGLSLSQPLQVSGIITLSNGNLNTSGQNLTLLSSAAGTALVDNSGGVVNGTATVQRYIEPTINGGRGYRHYSSPVAATTVSDLSTPGYAPVVNPAYNTVGNSVTPFPTVFSYDETRVNTSGNPAPQDFDKGYFSPGSPGDALQVTRGYTVNILASETVDFVGTLNNGPLTATSLTRGDQTESGYHLRGNPYPAPLNWDLLVSNARLTNIDNALYVFKSSGQYTGSYASYVNGIGLNGGTNVLPSSQGFFVRTSAAGQTGSIAFTNAERLTTTITNTPFQRGTADARPQLSLTLRNASTATQAAVYFENGATPAFDAAFDAYALTGGNGLNLATEAGAQALAINGQPALTGADVLLPLRLSAATPGTYALAVDQLANLPASYHAYLRDALTGTFTDLATTPAISLTLTTNAPATGRYALLFTTQQRVLTTAPAALARLASVYPNPARGAATLLLPVALRGTQATAVSVVDNLGRTVLARTLAAGTVETLELPLTGLAPGIYSVQARTTAGLVVKRLVVE